MTRALVRPLLLVALAAVLAAVAGCARQVHRSAHNAVVDVTIDEYSLTPTDITVAHGGRLTIRVHNKGVLAHNLAVMRARLIVARSATIDHGASTALTVDLKPARYRLISSLSDDDVLGIAGGLRVRR
ncbi:MAG TPA: cupredoxin domain-containing protein [Solirubrobacteraceae bacterium]|nr:cupredoxin domain-containing protein [Solirubrobacteraceae bacterium]